MALAPGARNKFKSEWITRRADNMSALLPLVQTRQADTSLVADFDALYLRYEKPLFNLIFQWIGNYEDAQDIAVETFTAAYKARDSFRGESQVYTWLYRIAHNQCKNRFKQRDRQREMEGPSLDAGLAMSDADEQASPREIADWSYSPAHLLDQKETRALIEQAIDSLASDYKVVLVLRELEGLSYNEIAEVTELTLEAVKTRLNRARAMVRNKVEPQIKNE